MLDSSRIRARRSTPIGRSWVLYGLIARMMALARALQLSASSLVRFITVLFVQGAAQLSQAEQGILVTRLYF